MGLRFRRSIKLAPGLRLNASKRGASLSVGGRGATWNVSSRGTRTTLSVPGTGVSWTSYSSHGRSPSRAGPSPGPTQRQVAAAQRRAQREQRVAAGELVIEQETAELDKVIDQWRDVPPVPSLADFQAACVTQPYVHRDPPPRPVDLGQLAARRREELASTCPHGAPSTWELAMGPVLGCGVALVGVLVATVVGWVFDSTAGVIVSGGLAVAVGAALAAILFARANTRARVLKLMWIERELERSWDDDQVAANRAHISAVVAYEAEKAGDEDTWNRQEEARVAWMRRLILGDPAAIEGTLEAELEGLDFPFETEASVSVTEDGEAYLLVDLPEIEDVIPDTKTRVLKSGELREINRPVKERREAYATLVAGLVLQLTRVAFTASPRLHVVHLAAYTQRRVAKTGALRDEFVVELALDRAQASHLPVETMDPVEHLRDLASCRVKYTKTLKMSRITAPGWAGA